MKARQFHNPQCGSLRSRHVELCNIFAMDLYPASRMTRQKRWPAEPGNSMTSDTAFAYFFSSRKIPEIEIMKAFRLPRLPSRAILYVEFRKDGIPIDPGPWWAVNEGQKVRG